MSMIVGSAVFGVLYNIIEPSMWVGLLFALAAGLLRVRPLPVLVGAFGLFGIRVMQTYDPSVGLHPWPYIIALIAVFLAIATYLIGLGISKLPVRPILSMAIGLLILGALLMARSFWAMPVDDTPLLRHVREVTTVDDDRFHELDLELLYSEAQVPVAEVVDDLAQAGFGTSFVTDPPLRSRSEMKRCGRLYIPTVPGPGLQIVVSREGFSREQGRGFMAVLHLNDECLVTRAEAAWMLANTL